MDTLYLENAETNRFYELSLIDQHVEARYGIIGKPCIVISIKVKKKTIERFSKITETIGGRWEEINFKPTTKNHQTIDGSVFTGLYTDDIRNHSTYDVFISDTNYDFFEEGENNRILVAQNGLTFDGDLDFDLFHKFGIVNYGLIVDGDVLVHGYIHAEINMTILGNLKSKSIYKNLSHVIIKGDLIVDQTVLGIYNDGSLKIKGDVKAEVWISDDHDMSASGNYDTKESYTGYSFHEKDISDWMNEELYYYDEDEEEPCFDSEKAVQFIKEGKNLLK